MSALLTGAVSLKPVLNTGPMAAMKFTNRLGNKAFGLVFSFLLGQRIKDTLCGTKVLWRRDWQRLSESAR